jgi:hypothetical protein
MVSNMNIKVCRDNDSMDVTYTIVLNENDIASANFTEFDRRLFDDCESEDATISDKVLALETVIRRIEQSKE